MDWFIPITSALLLTNGPPELPGFMAASVWILFLSKSTLLIIPVVKVLLNPKGLPMAKTFCPTFNSFEFPKVIVFRGLFDVIFINLLGRSLSFH